MREKFRYFPTAWNTCGDKPEPEPVPVYDGPRYPCPCCGYLTFPVPKEEAIAYICPVCFWENDVFDPEEDAPSDENHGMTLREGRASFQKCGAADPRFVDKVRPPSRKNDPEV